MSQNQSMENAKSLPCMETSRILVESDHSMSSYKSCIATVPVADSEEEIEKSTLESRPSVKALIDKHRWFQDKSMNAKVANFNVKKKSFVKACESLNRSYEDCCRNMEGDTKQVDKVENVVKNHVFEMFNGTIYDKTGTAKSIQGKNYKQVPENFNFKTDTPELDETVNDMGHNLWENIISLININRDYYQCLMQIMDTKKFNDLDNVKVYVGLALKQGERMETVESNLIAYCQSNMKKIGLVLDRKNKLYIESMTKDPFFIYHSKFNELKNELLKTKKSTKDAEYKNALLEREKRDLLNILNSYDNENVHKVSLEKQLKAEKLNNDKLREMISKVFKHKMPFYEHFNED